MVEVVIKYFFTILGRIFRLLAGLLYRRDPTRTEFQTKDEIVWLLYTNSMLWLICLYWPFMVFFQIAFLYLHFRAQHYMLRKWSSSPLEANTSVQLSY